MLSQGLSHIHLRIIFFILELKIHLKNIVRSQSRVIEGFLLDGFKLRGVVYIWAAMVVVKSYCFYL